MPASNTRDCFRLLLDHRVVGLLFDALPYSDSAGTRALVLYPNGSYYVERADQVRRAVDRKRRQLEETSRELRDVLALAGADQPAPDPAPCTVCAYCGAGNLAPHTPSCRIARGRVATEGNDTVTARDEPKAREEYAETGLTIRNAKVTATPDGSIDISPLEEGAQARLVLVNTQLAGIENLGSEGTDRVIFSVTGTRVVLLDRRHTTSAAFGYRPDDVASQ